MGKVLKENPVRRLQNNIVPDLSGAQITNPIVRRLMQIPGFGNGTCTPQMAGIKLRESFASIPAPTMIQNIAHAKRWVHEHIITYVDGFLPTIIRKFKYLADLKKLIQLVARIVATLRFLQALVQREVALANAWARECVALIDFAERTLTPAGLQTEAESEMVTIFNRAKASINQQVSENNENVACLI